jgi:hypothetical protein
VLLRAKQLQESGERLTAVQVFDRLCRVAEPVVRALEVSSQKFLRQARWRPRCSPMRRGG